MKGIVSTLHAVDRARGRLGFEGEHPDVCRRIAADVREALEAGRYSKRVPSFMRFSDGVRPCRPRQHASNRYVWSADEQRVYVVCRGRRDTDVVITCFPAASPYAPVVAA